MDQDENGNFVYVMRKVSPDSQLNSSFKNFDFVQTLSISQ
jgi:hypothetical protein